MHQFLIALFMMIQVSATFANSTKSAKVPTQAKECTELRSWIQSDLSRMISEYSGRTQKEYFGRLIQLQKEFDFTYLSDDRGYGNQPNLIYATSLMEMLATPGAKFEDLQKILNANNCLDKVARFKQKTRSFFRNAVSTKEEYLYDTEAWKTYESLLYPICKMR